MLIQKTYKWSRLKIQMRWQPKPHCMPPLHCSRITAAYGKDIYSRTTNSNPHGPEHPWFWPKKRYRVILVSTCWRLQVHPISTAIMEVKTPLRIKGRTSLFLGNVKTLFWKRNKNDGWTNMIGSDNRVKTPVAMPKAAKEMYHQSSWSIHWERWRWKRTSSPLLQ